ADEIGDRGIRGPCRSWSRGPEVARQHTYMVGRVVELLGRGGPEPDKECGRVLGNHRNASLEVRPRGRVEERIAERIKGESDIFRCDRLAVLPAGSRPEMKAPGYGVEPFPPCREPWLVGSAVDRRSTGGK